MAISYSPLWHLLIERETTKTEMRSALGLSTSTLAKMGRNEYVALEVIDKICTLYEVQPGDVIKWSPE